jgi:type II secretory pathway pseudopilin PulG
MRIYPKLQAADAKEMSRQGELAFTMIEIAIAIGVIGFALVAIIGILPTGLNVQKDNREDTLVSQDAAYFLDAIRNGATIVSSTGGPVIARSAQALDFLTNYVQTIRFDYVVNGATNNLNVYSNFNSGAEIIGLLTTPQTNFANAFFSNNFFDVTATVRALSGPATEQQSGANTGLSGAMAFTYNVEVMVTPFNSFAPSATNWAAAIQNGADPAYVTLLSNRWVEANPNLGVVASPYITSQSGSLVYNLFDVRLHFSWPVLPNGHTGPNHQTYRSLIAAQMAPAATNNVVGWFFQPQSFATNVPNGL